MCFILAVSIFTIVSEREMNAHIDPYVGAFVYLMQWQILLCILAMLLMDAEMTDEVGDLTVGILLMFVNILMALVVVVDTRGDVVREAREKANVLKLRNVLRKADERKGRRRRLLSSIFVESDEDHDMKADETTVGPMEVNPMFRGEAHAERNLHRGDLSIEMATTNGVEEEKDAWTGSAEEDVISIVTTNGVEEEKDSSTGGAEEDVMSIDLVATYGAGRAEDAESDKFELIFQHERVPVTVDAPNKIQDSLHDGAEIDVSFQDLESSVNRFTDVAGAQPEKRQESARMQPQSERAAPQVFEVEVDHTQDDAADELEDDYANLIEACGVSEELMFALIEEVTQPNGHIAGARLMEILNTYQLLRDFESARAMVHKSTKSATTLWMTTDAAPKAATKLWLALGLDDSSSSGDVNFIVFSKSMSRKLGPLCPAEAELQEVYDAFKHRMDAIKDAL